MDEAPALDRTLTRDLLAESDRERHGIRGVLGQEAWLRLPEAVRERFADAAAAVTYAGGFEVVRASRLGRVFAWLGKLLGTPVAPRQGENVAARVRVRPDRRGVTWLREYRWEDGTEDCVQSTKVVDENLALIEKLPAGLCMPLDVYEDGGVLHFVSRGYYFDLCLGNLSVGDLALGAPGFRWKLWLPTFLTPGVTHVEHIDLGHGWFRFTMTVTHPLFGELFFQTGRFCEECT